MNHIDRLLSELTTLFDDDLSAEDLKLYAHLHLSAFIGRVALRDDGYATPEESAPVLQEAREALHMMPVQGRVGFVRMELLTELDKVIASVRRNGV